MRSVSTTHINSAKGLSRGAPQSLSTASDITGLPICTLGATGHGKTTLTAALGKVVARIGAIHTDIGTAFAARPPTQHPIREGVGITYRRVAYETSGKFYTHLDCEMYLDVVKMLVSGSPPIQGAIWVVSAEAGVTAESEAHLRLASQVHLQTVVPFLNTFGIRKGDELLSICEEEMAELMAAYGWDTERTPVIVGDARTPLSAEAGSINAPAWQPIVDLIFTMNRAMPAPVDITGLPLLMPIHEIAEETKERVSVRGPVVQGQVAVGQAVDIVGKGDRIKTRVLRIKEDTVAVESDPEWLSIGQVLCTPKTLKSHTEFTALIYLLSHEESGTHIPLIENDRPEVSLWGADVPSHLKLGAGLSLLTPGAYAEVSLTLTLPLVMSVGTRFAVKKMGVPIGFGVVTGLLS